MGDKSKEAAQAMSKGAARKVKARLTRRAQHRLQQFCKQAQGLVDEVEIGKRSFPDGGVRSAMRHLLGSLEDHLEAIKEVAQDAGEHGIVEIIEEAADALAPVDPDEGNEPQPEDHGDDVEVSGLSESEEESPVDISSIDETPLHN